MAISGGIADGPWTWLLEPYEGYLADKIGACPDLSRRRLFREIKELGYEGGYTAVTDYLCAFLPDAAPKFECRFETKPGEQAQADFGEFKTDFADEPGVFRKVHLFPFVLGYSHWLLPNLAKSVLHPST